MKIKHLSPGILVSALLLAGCGSTANQQAAATNPAMANTTRAAGTVRQQPVTSSAVPSPTASASPSVPAPSASATVQAGAQGSVQAAPNATNFITINAPAADASITSPVVVSGDANFWPFEGTLTGTVKGADGSVLGVAPLTVQSPGAPAGGPWVGEIAFDVPPGTETGTLEVAEISAKDGTATTIQTVPVRLDAAQPLDAQAPRSAVELNAPQFAQNVTLPLHVAVRVNPPQQVTARLVYSNGTVLEAPVSVATGSDGVGYGVLNLQWTTEAPPPDTAPGAATLRIVGGDGTILQELTVNVLGDDASQPVRVAWRGGDQIVEFEQRVPATAGIGAAALRELLNGPINGNAAGVDTALPSTEEIVTFAERDATWSYRVQLLDLAIENGVATANFSKELRAYGGDTARAAQIREQIERTLQQFPTVESVVILIDGSALQP